MAASAKVSRNSASTAGCLFRLLQQQRVAIQVGCSLLEFGCCSALTRWFCDQNMLASACPALQVTAVQCWEVALGAGLLESCSYLVKAQITLLPSFFAEADSLQVGDSGQPDAALCHQE